MLVERLTVPLQVGALRGVVCPIDGFFVRDDCLDVAAQAVQQIARIAWNRWLGVKVQRVDQGKRQGQPVVLGHCHGTVEGDDRALSLRVLVDLVGSSFTRVRMWQL